MRKRKKKEKKQKEKDKTQNTKSNDIYPQHDTSYIYIHVCEYALLIYCINAETIVNRVVSAETNIRKNI